MATTYCCGSSICRETDGFSCFKCGKPVTINGNPSEVIDYSWLDKSSPIRNEE